VWPATVAHFRGSEKALDTVTGLSLDNDMPATTTHYVAKATETEAAMSATTIKPGTTRWLSSQGHPGYGSQFAFAVWCYITDTFGASEFDNAPTMRQSGMVWAGVRSILDRAS